MAKTAVRRVAPISSEEPDPGLTWPATKAAAEIYWPGLGGKVVAQMQEWNRDLFDNKFRPVPLVLSRMSSVEGHFFPTLDRANQRMGFEGQLVTQTLFYTPPRAITYVRRDVLIRTMIHQLRRQDGLAPFLGNSQEWCDLIMDLHRRLTGERIWCAPEYEETTPRQDLGKGLYRPAETHIVQDTDPETGAPSLPRDKVVGWPGTVMDLGRITRGE